MGGQWTVDYSHFVTNNLTGKVTSLSSDSWSITSACGNGSCSARLSGTFQDKTLNMTLRPRHGTYSGKATIKGYIQCKETTVKEPNYLTFTLKPTAGSVVGDQWEASTFTGTFSDTVPYFGGCSSAGFSSQMHGSM